jgi:fibronectin type 3 domain-containing protein
MTLAWQAVSGANGYKVYRSLSASGAFSLLVSTAFTSYTDTGLASESIYYYKVSSIDTGGESAMSAVVGNKTSVPEAAQGSVPPAPAGLSIAEVTSGSISLSWTAVSGVSYYKIYRADSASGTYTQAGLSDVNSYTNYALTPNTTYYYKISAVNDTGESAQSGSVFGTTEAQTGGGTLPAAPSGLAVTGVSAGTISLAWNTVSGAIYYRIYRATSSDGAYNQVGVNTVNSYMDYVPSSGTYYYKVSAGNAAGEGGLSAYTQGASVAVLPAAPSGFAVTGVTSNSISLSWDAAAGAIYYRIYRATSAGGAFTFVGISDIAAYTDSGLTPDTLCYYKVSAVNSAGNESLLTAAVDGRTSPGGSGAVPGVPAGLTITAVTSNSISLSWGAVSGVSGYRIYCANSADGAFTQAGTSAANSYTDFGLSPVTTYYYKVSALNGAGEGALTQAVNAQTEAEGSIGGAESAPTITASDSIFTVQWNAVENAVSYEVYINTSAARPAAPAKTVSGTTTVLTGLVNRTLYYVWVKAVLSAGASVLSRPATAKPWASDEVPETPGLPVIVSGVNQLTVSWQKVSGASLYEVYINTDMSIPAMPEQTITQTSDTISQASAVIGGLETNVVYYVWIRAVNSAGASGYSPVESGIPNIPSPPGTPQIVSGNGQITVTWSAVYGALAYEVWMGTTNSFSSAVKQGGDVTGLSKTITGLSNGTTYYLWLKSKNNAGTSGESQVAMAVPISDTPPTPALTSANTQLTASWDAITGATQYEVYYSTSTTMPASPAQTVSTTSATITGLTNGSTYYVWVKSKNANGYGSANAAVSAKPVGNMSAVTLTSANAQLTVSWTAVDGATEYEVYYSTSTTMPASSAQTVSTTSATITGLTNGTTYYIWVKPKNANGYGSASTAVSGTPDIAEIYKGATYETAELIGAYNLENALTYISGNAVSGDNYYIVIGADVTMAAKTLSFSGKTVTITLMGFGAERQISLSGTGALFTVSGSSGKEVTLVLDSNISLNGVADNTNALVNVNSYGKLIMESGSKIFGNTNSQSSNYAYGGGVYVSGGTFTMSGGTISSNTVASSIYGLGGGVYVNSGTFTMTGGTISGNTSSGGGGVYMYSSGTFTMSGGTISGNNATSSNGGGVCVSSSVTFTMSGGTISGNTSSNGGGGVHVYANGTFTKSGNSIIYGNDADASLKNTAASSSYGHAVYIVSGSKKRNTTADASVALDSSLSGSAGGWE